MRPKPTGRTARSICSTRARAATRRSRFGKVDAAYGRASLASARRAIKAALAGEVEAVVAAPQTERSIAAAGIAFDGYPSFVARETGTPVEDVYLMICFDDSRIVHATLHLSVREALDADHARARRAASSASPTPRSRSSASRKPKIFVSRAQSACRRRRPVRLGGNRDHRAGHSRRRRPRASTVEGPFGADTMFRKKGCDAFIVMLHDQGHIAAKLLGLQPHRRAVDRLADFVLLGRARQRARHRRQGQGRSRRHDRGDHAAGERLRRQSPGRLAHDPEKWTPVFGKDHVQEKMLGEQVIQSKRIAL